MAPKINFIPTASPGGDDDPVNHPHYYCRGNIEVIDFITDQNMNYIEGNIIKYICRYKYKAYPLEDLRKARRYLDMLIAREEKPPVEQ